MKDVQERNPEVTPTVRSRPREMNKNDIWKLSEGKVKLLYLRKKAFSFWLLSHLVASLWSVSVG